MITKKQQEVFLCIKHFNKLKLVTNLVYSHRFALFNKNKETNE